MSLKAAVRGLVSRNRVTRGWFVGFCARFTMRLYNLQSWLSLDDLRAKRRAAQWRTFLAILDRPDVLRVVIAQGKATFHYADGCAFHASADRASISGTQFSHGEYEAAEGRVMGEVVQPGWTVVDVGANFGWHAVHLAKRVGPGGRVLAFEPIPATFAELVANVELNGATNLEARPMALGPVEEVVGIYLPASDLGAGAASQHLDLGERIQVPMVPLDVFLAREGVDRVDFIKTDIEGGELDMLKGARDLLARCHPAILVEIVDIHCRRFGHDPEAVIAFLEGLGYRGRYIEEQGGMVAFDASRPPNGNYLFQHR
jgi:FkbM family methyltransferase